MLHKLEVPSCGSSMSSAALHYRWRASTSDLHKKWSEVWIPHLSFKWSALSSPAASQDSRSLRVAMSTIAGKHLVYKQYCLRDMTPCSLCRALDFDEFYVFSTPCSTEGCSGLRQYSHSRFRVPRDPWPYFCVAWFLSPETGVSCMYVCMYVCMPY
jgi:hypothetical protein